MNKEDVVYVYSGILFNHKKGGNPAICNNMNRFASVTLSKITQTEKGKYSIISFICRIQKQTKAQRID